MMSSNKSIDTVAYFTFIVLLYLIYKRYTYDESISQNETVSTKPPKPPRKPKPIVAPISTDTHINFPILLNNVGTHPTPVPTNVRDNTDIYTTPRHRHSDEPLSTHITYPILPDLLPPTAPMPYIIAYTNTTSTDTYTTDLCNADVCDADVCDDDTYNDGVSEISEDPTYTSYYSKHKYTIKGISDALTDWTRKMLPIPHTTTTVNNNTHNANKHTPEQPPSSSRNLHHTISNKLSNKQNISSLR